MHGNGSQTLAVRSVSSHGSSLFLLVFSGALFCSAFLLFLVEPLVAKTLLPALGGTPQVWNTCMVFFQATLFAAYLYAHLIGRGLSTRKQAILHMVLVCAALLMLPFGISSDVGTPDPSRPVLWLMGVLMMSLGVPLFLISATAPLLQKWVSHTRHPAAFDPYFLYAASNSGSLLALLAYPFLIEPSLRLREQWSSFSAGFIILAALLGLSVALLHRNLDSLKTAESEVMQAVAIAPVSYTDRLRWVLLSFAPTSLLLGVTTFITADIAAVPLFWVIPLALYLITFILVFAKRVLIQHFVALRVQAILITLLALNILVPVILVAMPALCIALHLIGFFFTALVCHGELARARPTAKHLTEFYLWLSLGGVLGGAFNALAAPAVFSQLAEYPLVLALACFLRPAQGGDAKQASVLDIMLAGLTVAAVWLALRFAPTLIKLPIGVAIVIIAAGAAAIVLLSFSTRVVRFGLAVFGVLMIPVLSGQAMTFDSGLGHMQLATRSFFGIYRVYHNAELDTNIFLHGSTVHGVQLASPGKTQQPTMYYHMDGPFGQLFRALGPVDAQQPIAVIGLGTGVLACYGARGSSWTYYEIDPVVEKIARDERFFTYLRDCPPTTNVVAGDARIALQDAPDHHYALLIVDAFSSDAIPTHLLTREALSLYSRKLTQHGVLAIHISNRYLDLAPVIGNLARDAGLVGRINKLSVPQGSNVLIASPALLTVLAASEADLRSIATDAGWESLPLSPQGRLWTDDYVNLLGSLRRPF